LVKQTPIEEGSLVVSRLSNQEGGDRSEVDEGNMIGVAFFFIWGKRINAGSEKR
jgi:hypothetical protein